MSAAENDALSTPNFVRFNEFAEINRGHRGIAAILIDLIACGLDQNRAFPIQSFPQCRFDHQRVSGAYGCSSNRISRGMAFFRNCVDMKLIASLGHLEFRLAHSALLLTSERYRFQFKLLIENNEPCEAARNQSTKIAESRYSDWRVEQSCEASGIESPIETDFGRH
jgi:hypothetical protein